MQNYYNEWEPYPAEWLRNLMLVDEIPYGTVDETDIRKIDADNLKAYTQCHFFAGIGGWSLALKLASWPEEREVWTGSCPCQPFSVAGAQKGKDDDRHLAPTWLNLIRERHPATIFGEQVTGAIAHGWFDELAEGLEKEGYAVGSTIIPACGVGAPHKRDRLWFVANTRCQYDNRRPIECRRPETPRTRNIISGSNEYAEHVAYTTSSGLFSATHSGIHSGEESRGSRHEQSKRCGFWEFEPSMGRVANGIPARSHKLRAYGNAIVPQVAAAFVTAFLQAEADLAP